MSKMHRTIEFINLEYFQQLEIDNMTQIIRKY